MTCRFFNDTATTEIYTLSLHDALPIYRQPGGVVRPGPLLRPGVGGRRHPRRHGGAGGADPGPGGLDRKSTRLNSSHANISYAVFCLKKNKTQTTAWRVCSRSTGESLVS